MDTFAYLGEHLPMNLIGVVESCKGFDSKLKQTFKIQQSLYVLKRKEMSMHLLNKTHGNC